MIGTAAAPVCLPLPLVHLGSVNVWLLRGEPLTLIDTGPATDAALTSLEEQLAAHGVGLADIEQVLLTHHHLDHSALAETIRARSGARVVAHRATADFGRRWHAHVAAERDFARQLIAEHGGSAAAIPAADRFFELIVAEGRPYEVDLVLSDGDLIRAGGRTLRTVFRPGHCTTDTLYVDDESDTAFVGDHLLALITTGAEMTPTELPGDERRRALMDYLGNLLKTEVMPLQRCFTGHGPIIEDHRALIEAHIAFHFDRLEQIRTLVENGMATAFDIARRLWSDRIATDSPILVVWEVLGHLDLLINRGVVREVVDAHGRHSFHPRGGR